MRTLSKLFASVVVLVTFLIFPVQVFAELDPTAWVSNHCDDGWWKISSHPQIGQTFKPTKNTIDKIGAYLNTTSGSASVTGQLWTGDGATKLAESAKTVNFVDLPAIGAWYYFDFSPDVSVTAGATYKLVLTASLNTAYWNIAQSPNNSYANGSAIIDSTLDTSGDFCFANYGYETVVLTPPPATPPPAAETPAAPTATTTEPAATDAPADVDTTKTTTTEPEGTALVKAKEATKSAGKTPATSSAETKGILQNPFVPVLLAFLIILIGGGIGYFTKKKLNARSETSTPPTSV